MAYNIPIYGNLSDPTEQGVYQSSLTKLATGLVLVSGTAYFVYLGRTSTATQMNFVRFHVVTAGAGVQAAEVGLFSTPLAPNGGAAQTLTRIVATNSVTSLTSTGLKLNLASFATTVPAGTQIWAGIRTAMAATQPSITQLTLDNSFGAILSLAAAGDLTAGGGTFAANKITASAAAQCPALTVSQA